MTLRTRTLKKVGSTDTEAIDVEDDTSEDVFTGNVEDDVSQEAIEVDANAASQLAPPAATPTKKRTIKRTLGAITSLLDNFVCPHDSDIPSKAELVEVLKDLYHSQTHLIDSYQDLPGMLEMLPEFLCDLLLVTVDDPEYLYYAAFVNVLATNHLGLIRQPILFNGRDNVLKLLNGVCSSFLLIPLGLLAF